MASVLPKDEPEFKGTERFLIEKRLGAGAMGIVYRVQDRERDCRVALKLLRRVDPMGIYRFKQEFRALADINHPNLATLYELVAYGDSWFFTMEIVEGVDFLTYVRGAAAPGTVEAARTAGAGQIDPLTTATGAIQVTRETAEMAAPSSTSVRTQLEVPSADSVRSARLGSTAPSLSGEDQFARLRRATRQLVKGLQALHEAGHLHRDVKPSNILVTGEDRVVLLDFGVITELAKQRESKGARALVGTPAYMSPEQAAGKPLTPACDWYAVGVVLYEALAGRPPFLGDTRTVLEAKRIRDAPTLDTIEGLPSDLATACERLLARDPDDRMTGTELLQVLEGTAARRSFAPVSVAVPEHEILVGREPHLKVLSDAYAAVCADEPHSVFVSGPSGSGKSALCACFLDQVTVAGDALVLRGRCYEQESVPYKALDSLVDELCEYLLGLSTPDVRDLVPRNVQALSRLFPVLNGIQAVREASTRALETPDPHELRRRGFTAMRRLLTRLAERRPLILYVDDLQWADTESAELLAEVMRPPDPPVMLLLASFRSEGAEESAFLRAVRQIPALKPGPSQEGSIVELAVEDLPHGEAVALALQLLERDDAAGEARDRHADEIARESAGNPLFIHELVRYASTVRDPDSSRGAVTLEGLMRARLSELDEAPQRLLEFVAVAGRPVPRGVATEAAELGEEGTAAFQSLRKSLLVRTTGSRTEDRIEVYHDRIRAAVVDQLSEERRRRHHRRLAIALQAHGGDAETLAVHFDAAGDTTLAAEYCEKAAHVASESLAFDRAAALFERALERSADDSVELRIQLADALANAGRGLEAADTYLEAAQCADEATRLDCERHAADQLLRSGYIARAIETLTHVLAHVGTQMPANPRRALLAVAWGRLKIKLRGLKWKEREESQVPPESLLRIDVYQAVAKCLAVVDTVRGADFQARGLLAALRAGEKARVARAMCLEAGYNASQGRHARARPIMAYGLELAATCGDPATFAQACAIDGMVYYFACEFVRATERLAEAESLFLDHTMGTAWEVSTARLSRLWALRFLGAYVDMRRLFDQYVRDARRRGDRYVETTMRRLCSELWLIQDNPAGARENLARATWMPPEGVFHLQHWYELRARGEVLLYEASGARALAESAERLQIMSKSLLLRVQIVRAESRWFHARLMLAASREAKDPKPLHRAAAKLARQVAREKMPVTKVWAAFLEAALAAAQGQKDWALAQLDNARTAAEATAMPLHVAVAQRRRGELLGGTEGESLIQSADAWMQRARIRNPRRMARMLVPAVAPSRSSR